MKSSISNYVTSSTCFNVRSSISFQIREEILNESIYCPAEKAVLLASFAVQAKFSDFDESIHTPGNDV